MTASSISDRAAFDRIRYAQLWEDADVLTAAMGDIAGKRVVSIASAGDNALALLTLDPAEVIAVDLSPAQLECVRLRIGAYRALTHGEFLELMGSRPSVRRAELLRKATSDLPEASRQFWMALAPAVAEHGAGGVGKFERYFRLFRRWVLPLAHSRRTVADIFVPRPPAERAQFFETRFDTWRWRLLVRAFFSRFVMGRVGRDRAFFDHVSGSAADHVFSRLRHAAVETDPAANAYLHWIMTGTHGTALPLAWRAEHYALIRDRTDRISLHLGPLETLSAREVGGFNLSDIFEYMPPEALPSVYSGILAMAEPGARLVYWNMMAPRRRPHDLAGRLRRLEAVEDRLKRQDMAFFYSDFVVEEVQ